MIIKSLELKETAFDESSDNFSDKRNLIFSKRNSLGKSTFLRLLFYSLGYQIPNMKGALFRKIETKITFEEKNNRNF